MSMAELLGGHAVNWGNSKQVRDRVCCWVS